MDLVVLVQSTYETSPARTILGSIRERFGVGAPVLLHGHADDSDWTDWVDGILNLRYVSDHVWKYFPKSVTFRGPEGRFYILCDPISESNFHKIQTHLDSIRSTTLRNPNGHGLYLRLHAAHLRVPPGILSSKVCIDAILRMFSRMHVHSGATFLSAELDPELVGAPPEQQGES